MLTPPSVIPCMYCVLLLQMQVGDTVKEVNGELLDDKTPSEGVWVGVESDWVSGVEM